MIAFDPASFKDPAGRVFYGGDAVYRTLSAAAAADLEAAHALLRSLIAERLVVESEIVRADSVGLDSRVVGERVLKQRRLPFVSYSYEWSAGMLRAAALTTLRIMARALEAGFVLKDANAFNVLFDGGTALLVDVPSIERYHDGRIWAGYGQFCRSFFAPLLLGAYRGVDARTLLRSTLGEVPLTLAARLFPRRDWLRPGVLKDVVLPARLERSFGQSQTTVRRETASERLPKALLVANVARLTKIVAGLRPESGASEWSAYEADCTYTAEDRAAKSAFVAGVLERGRFGRVVDLGCNVGTYSRLAAERGARVVALDLDSRAIDALFESLRPGEPISPLVGDLLNPTPAMGWDLAERRSLFDRVGSDAFLALALIHHLRITGGVPLDAIVARLLAIAPEGVVEWVDKSDAQVQRMLALRPDVYDDYTWPSFESILKRRGELVAVHSTHDGRRRLCHVRSNGAAKA